MSKLKLKRSLAAFAGVLALVSAVALLTPQTGRAQKGGSPTPLNVNVVNTEAAPVPVRDLPVEPFNKREQLVFSDGQSIRSERVLDVPPGKQLVVTYASASANVPDGQQVIIAVRAGDSSDGVLHYLKPAAVGSGFVASESVQFRLGAGNHVSAIVTRTRVAGDAGVGVSISGYLVDVPPAQ